MNTKKPKAIRGKSLIKKKFPTQYYWFIDNFPWQEAFKRNGMLIPLNTDDSSAAALRTILNFLFETRLANLIFLVN